MNLDELVGLLNQLELRFRVRRRTAAGWVTSDEVLLSAEIGYETDTGKFKFGDGVTAWTLLPYAAGGAYTRGAAWDSGSINPILESEVKHVKAVCPADGTILNWTIMAEGGVGSCEIDIWKTSYADTPGDVTDSITGSLKPAVSSATKATDDTLPGWDVDVQEGDVLTFVLESNAVFTNVSIFVKIG